MNDPLGEAELYVDLGHDFIAIGSNSQRKHIAKIVEKFPKLKLHLFGKLNRKLLFEFKPYSADSAGYRHHSRFGSIYYWDYEDNREYSIYFGERDRDFSKDKSNIHFNQFHHKKELEEFLWTEFSYTLTDLLTSKGYIATQVVNMRFMSQLEEQINSMK